MESSKGKGFRLNPAIMETNGPFALKGIKFNESEGETINVIWMAKYVRSGYPFSLIMLWNKEVNDLDRIPEDGRRGFLVGDP